MDELLKRYAPPGMELRPWKSFMGISLGGCGALSFYGFFAQMFQARAKLFDPRTGELTGNIIGWDFGTVLGNTTLPFFFVAAAMGAFLVINYLYFFEGSKSIYTMARLKSPWQLHIRCWTLPLLGAAALLLCRVVLIVVYYLVFLLATPKGVPLPGFYHLLGGLLL